MTAKSSYVGRHEYIETGGRSLVLIRGCLSHWNYRIASGAILEVIIGVEERISPESSYQEVVIEGLSCFFGFIHLNQKLIIP